MGKAHLSAILEDGGGEDLEQPTVDQKVQERLGRQLKALYDDVVKQPIPDRLLSLIAQLEEKQPESETKGSDER